MRVLITGSTGNIGKEVALLAAKNNWSCDKVHRKNIPSEEGARGVDLTRWYASDYYIQYTNKEGYDLVVMAHGTQKPMRIVEMTPTSWCDILDSNLTSCVALTQALVRHGRLKEGSLIVYCSSIQSNTPREGRGAYAAAKAGLEAFAKVAAAELAPNTRVVALRLGQLTKTMNGVVFDPEQLEKLQKRSLLPWVEPAEVAQLCFDLYKQKSITGSIIDLDSGHGRNIW